MTIGERLIQGIKQQRYCWAAVLICLLIAGYLASARQIVFLDEQFSLAHANSSQGAFMAPDIGTFMTYEDGENFYGKWIEGDSFRNYLSSQKAENFRYDFIGENLKQDVHPPLYFWMVHTVCSFFTGRADLHLLLAVNLILYVLMIWGLFRVAQFLGASLRQAFAVCLLWGLSSGGLITVLFARMYMLQTLCFLGIGYELLKLMQTEKVQKCSLMRLGLWMLAAMLTQYHSLFLILVSVELAVLVALYQKQYQKIGILFAIILAVSAAFFLIYPESVQVMMHSQRGEEAWTKVGEGWKNPLLWSAMLVRGGQVMFKNLLGISGVPAWGYVLLFGVSVIGLMLFCRQKMWWLIAGGVLVAGLGTAFLMPFMYEFDVRYFSPLLPWTALVVVYLVCNGTEKWTSKIKPLIMALLLAGCAFLGIRQTQEIFWRHDKVQNARFLQQVKGKDVFVLENYHLILFYERAYYLQNARRVFADRSGMCPAWVNQLEQYDGDFVLVLNGEDKYHQGYDFAYRYPAAPLTLCKSLAQQLNFLGYVRFGERFYDWYEIKK